MLKKVVMAYCRKTKAAFGEVAVLSLWLLVLLARICGT